MKILHTSDIHLREYNDERWESLISLLKLARELNVDVFAISGDLFNKDFNAEELRPHIRELFSNNDFILTIIAGNHDSNSFREGLFFGGDARIITELNNPVELEGLRIWGFPFEPISKERVFESIFKIKDRLTNDKTNILLYHGELIDASFSRGEFGEEGEERYMPIQLSFFDDLNFKYILAGHFHTRTEIWTLDNDNFFAYSGSPVSITKKEKGRRRALFYEIGKPPQEILLDTPHFEEIVFELDPFEDKNYVKIMQDRFNNLHRSSKVCLMVKGFINSSLINKTESELINEFKEISKNKCVDESFLFEDINTILEDELFQKFKRKLDKKDFDQKQRNYMTELTIQAFRRLKT